jgi:hypothetical protein
VKLQEQKRCQQRWNSRYKRDANNSRILKTPTTAETPTTAGMLKTEVAPAIARKPTERTPTRVQATGIKGMSTTTGPQQQQFVTNSMNAKKEETQATKATIGTLTNKGHQQRRKHQEQKECKQQLDPNNSRNSNNGMNVKNR